MKPVIKTKSLECVMVMFEVTENFEAETMDALEELCKSKMAKVISIYLHLGLINCSWPACQLDASFRHKEICPLEVQHNN